VSGQLNLGINALFSLYRNVTFKYLVNVYLHNEQRDGSVGVDLVELETGQIHRERKIPLQPRGIRQFLSGEGNKAPKWDVLIDTTL